MRGHMFFRISRSLCFLVCLVACAVHAQINTAGSNPCARLPMNSFRAMPNGIAVGSGDVCEVITALRPDILRVRIARRGVMPEDASWAVLADARRSVIHVDHDVDPHAVGFHTSSLRALIDRKTLELTVRDSDGKVVQGDARPINFDQDSFTIYKSMPADEHYFGLGDKPGPLDRRHEAFTLWNTDAYRFQESTDPLYKSIPFFLTDRAGSCAGVLLDNTWRSQFDFGKSIRGVYSFGAENGPVNYYILYGPSPKHVVESYAWLTGTPPLPPLWTLGYQQSRYSYFPQSRVLEIAQRLRHDRIPADAIYLDIDFQEKNRPFTVDTERFPDFSGMIKTLATENFHVVAITDLHIADLPERHYFPYDSGVAGNEFVKNPDGSVYSGVVWPGPSVFPDFTRQQTRQWWGTLYQKFSSEGIAGFWNDMNEPSIFNTESKTMPLDVVHRIDEPGFVKRTATHAEIHNVYGMENSRATYEGLKRLHPDIRPFVLTRATFAGGQRYAATWTGDNSSTWNHLRMTTPMLENLGLSGFSFSGADVGGYAGSPPPDLLTKWFEIAAFQPIDRDHTEKGTRDQEPWVGGPEQEDIRRRFIEERYRLMPYIYTLAEESSRTGLPMERPLFLEFPNAAQDHHPIDIDVQASGEFLLGPDLLIAPSPFPEELDDHTIEFPSVAWYDYWTGEKVRGTLAASSANPAQPIVSALQVPMVLQVPRRLEELPVFVRAGSILPVAPLVQSTNEIPDGPLVLRVYAPTEGTNQRCQGSIYLDDGRTLAYQKGDYLRIHFACHVSSNGLQVRIGRHQGKYQPWWHQVHIEIFGWVPKLGTAQLDGHAVASSAMNLKHQRLSIDIADHPEGADLLFR